MKRLFGCEVQPHLKKGTASLYRRGMPLSLPTISGLWQLSSLNDQLNLLSAGWVVSTWFWAWGNQITTSLEVLEASFFVKDSQMEIKKLRQMGRKGEGRGQESKS